VTLVGVIAADISINLPDFRSSERTFQLLSQVAGRAGRGSKPGEVVIQTFQPEHISVATAQVHDYLKLYEEVRDERSEVGYPPFRRLVNMLFTGEDVNAVIRASEDAKALLMPIKQEGVDLLGPVDCALERVQGRWRRHILLKFPDASLVSRVGELLAGFQVKGVQWTLDVDPFSLM
jgi:primosomal protein N' (replication factor Y)